MKKSAAAELPPKTLTEKEASELMTDIKEYRDYILAELAKGVSPEKVFAPFARLPEPAAPARRVR